jgi:hypothetical protein
MGFYDLLAEHKSVDALGKCRRKEWLNKTKGRVTGVNQHTSFVFESGNGGGSAHELPVPKEDKLIHGDIRRGNPGEWAPNTRIDSDLYKC